MGENIIRAGASNNLLSSKTGNLLCCLIPIGNDSIFINTIEAIVEVVEKNLQFLIQIRHKEFHSLLLN